MAQAEAPFFRARLRAHFTFFRTTLDRKRKLREAVQDRNFVSCSTVLEVWTQHVWYNRFTRDAYARFVRHTN